MYIFPCRQQHSIWLDQNIQIKVIHIKNGQVLLGIHAPNLTPQQITVTALEQNEPC